MNRYFSSFLITTSIYCSLIVGSYYYNTPKVIQSKAKQSKQTVKFTVIKEDIVQKPKPKKIKKPKPKPKKIIKPKPKKIIKPKPKPIENPKPKPKPKIKKEIIKKVVKKTQVKQNKAVVKKSTYIYYIKNNQ